MQCPHCQQQLPASSITPNQCPFCGQALRGATQPIDLPDLNDILPPEADTKRRLPTAMLQPEAAIELPPLDIAPLNPVGNGGNSNQTLAGMSGTGNNDGVLFPDMPAPFVPAVNLAPPPPPPAMPSFKPIAPPPPPPAMPSFKPIAPPPPPPVAPVFSPIAPPAPATAGSVPAADEDNVSGLLAGVDLDIPLPPPPPAPAPTSISAAPEYKIGNQPVMLPDLGAIAGLTPEEKASSVAAPVVPEPVQEPSIPLPDLTAIVGLKEAAPAIALPDIPTQEAAPSFVADLPLPAIASEPESKPQPLSIDMLDMPAPAAAPIAMDMAPLPPPPVEPAVLDMPAPLVMDMPSPVAPIALDMPAPIAMDMAPLPPPPPAEPELPKDMSLLPDIPDIAPLEDVPSVVEKMALPDIPAGPVDLLGTPDELLPTDAPSLLDDMAPIGQEDASLLPPPVAGTPANVDSDATAPEALDFAVEPTNLSTGSEPTPEAAQTDDQGNVALDNSEGSFKIETVARPKKNVPPPPENSSATEAAVPVVNTAVAANPAPEEAVSAPAKEKKANTGLLFGSVIGAIALAGIAMEFVSPYGYFGYKLFSDSLSTEVPPPVMAPVQNLPVATNDSASDKDDNAAAPAMVRIPDNKKIAGYPIEKLPALIEDLSTSNEDPTEVKPALVSALLRGYVVLGTTSYKNALVDLVKDDTDPVNSTIYAILAPKGTPLVALNKLSKVPHQKQTHSELTFYWQLQQKAYPKAFSGLKALCRKGSCRDEAISYLRQAPAKGPTSYMNAFSALPVALKTDPTIRVLVAHRLERDKDLAKVVMLLDDITLPQKELLPSDRSWLTMRDINGQIVSGHLKAAQKTIKELLAVQPSSVILQNSLGDISLWLKDYGTAATIFANLAADEQLTTQDYQAKAWFALIMVGDLETARKTLDNVSINDKKLPHYKLAEAWFNSLSNQPTKADLAELTKLYNKYPDLAALAMNFRPLVDMMEDSILLAANKPWSAQIQTQVRQLEYFTRRHMPVKAKEKVAQISPTSYHLVNPVDLRSAMANYLIMTGHPNEALQQITPVLNDLPEEVVLLESQGRAMAALGQHSGAAEVYKKASELSNKDMELMILSASEYLSAGDNNSALSLLNTLNDRYIGNEKILSLLARAWLESDHNKARRYITEAIQKNNKEASYYTILGICESRNSRTSDAIKNYKQALQLNPNDRVALRKLAEISLEDESYNQAISYLTSLSKLTPNDASVYTLMAQAHSELDHIDKAIAAYQTANRLAPNDANIMVDLAKLYQEQNKGADAQRLYERATKADPKNKAAFLQLGYFYKEQGRDRQAVEMFRKFLEIAPDDEQAQEIQMEISDLSH